MSRHFESIFKRGGTSILIIRGIGIHLPALKSKRVAQAFVTRKNLSQVEFGERCGFHQTYLSRIENGQANPTLNAMEVIANALGITIFDLFDKVRAEGGRKRG